MTLVCHGAACHQVVFAGRRVDTGARLFLDGNLAETSSGGRLFVIVDDGGDGDAVVMPLPAGSGLERAYREHRCAGLLLRRLPCRPGHQRSSA